MSISKMSSAELQDIDFDLLAAINAARKQKEPNASLEARANSLYAADRAFAVYGTLGPGRPNHHYIADIAGTWTQDTVSGSLQASGWGASLGYPALVWSATGAPVNVELLISSQLPQHWDRLDAFEGAEYARILVSLASGRVANIYAHANPVK